MKAREIATEAHGPLGFIGRHLENFQRAFLSQNSSALGNGSSHESLMDSSCSRSVPHTTSTVPPSPPSSIQTIPPIAAKIQRRPKASHAAGCAYFYLTA